MADVVTSPSDPVLRELLVRILSWEDAHVSFDRAVKGIPPALRGKRPPKAPHSPWQIVEHLRIAQHDILDFCRNPNYREMKWPDDYWPDVAPPSASAWKASIRRFNEDREIMAAMAADRTVALEATIPHGSGQTYLREILLAADHAAYHIGQLVLVRKMLGCWR